MSIAPISQRPVATAPAPAPIEQKPEEKKNEKVAKAEQKPAEKSKDSFETAPAAKKDMPKLMATADLKDFKPLSTEKPPRQSVSGEDKAKQEVDVKTVGERRTEIDDAQKKLREESTKKADELFAMADGKKPAPKDAEVKKLSDNEVELVRRNEKKEVLERTVVTRGKDEAITLDSASYADGMNRRERVETGKDNRTLVQQAEWKGEKNEAEALKSFGDIEKARDAGVTYTRNEVKHNKDGELELDEFAQADGSVTGSRSVFKQQKGGKSIDDKLEGPFDFKKPVDKAETFTYSIPAPGKDGKQEHPHYNRTQYFSQDKVQATSSVDRTLDGHTKYAGKGAHTFEDYAKVRDQYAKHGGEKYDADDGTKKGKFPKRWLVEVQKDNNSVDMQTFMEGSPKNSTITHRTRNGSEVKETYEGKAIKPGDKKGELGDVKGEATRKYAQDGSLEKMDAKGVEADGTTVENHYNSSRKPTDKGLELKESLETKRSKDGKTQSALQENTSLLSGQGAQLVDSRNTVTDAEGRKAVHETNKDGEKMTLTGPGGRDPRDISNPDDLKDDPKGKDLLLESGLLATKTAQDYVKNGGSNALGLLQTLSTDANKLPLGKAAKVLGNETLRNGLQGAKGATGAAGGALGVAAGGMQMAEGIRNKNLPDIFAGLTDASLGAYDVYAGGKSFYDAIKGVSDMATSAAGATGSMDDAAKALGSWAKASGVPMGKLGAAVSSSVLNSVQGMGGMAKVAGIGVKTMNTLKAMGGVANVAGAVAGTGLGVKDIVDGAKAGDKHQIAKGAVGIAGSIGGAVAAGAIGGPIGMGIGLGVGLLTFGIGKILDLAADREHQISKLKIG
ncbi:hypothetical protein [Hyalangium rubrum]|uniref:Uncharacterized protein n=1 Tax=Hyalangium rubrum TaxID=3103134 RepID=A0ABU5HFN3_9BACT|nr:hypothetical protein [Hyalangium sp. s54d21]MDY7232280.1 hypothetical protein [Hyalangium sp. s54d21]